MSNVAYQFVVINGYFHLFVFMFSFIHVGNAENSYTFKIPNAARNKNE